MKALILLLVYFPQIIFSQILSDVKINTDISISKQNYPQIDVDELGNFNIVWTDQREGNYSIYIQRLNSQGIRLGDNTKINYDNSQASSVEIAMKKNGNYFISWIETISAKNYYRLKYYSKYGDSLSIIKNFTDESLQFIRNQKMAVMPNGSLLICWLQYSQSLNFYKVYVQKFDSTGNKIGNKMLTTDSIIAKDNCTINCMGNGNFIIAWQENHPSNFGKIIAAQIFDQNGNKIGNKIIINDTTDSHDTYNYPRISYDSLNRFSISFDYYNSTINSHNVGFQNFNNDGSKNGANKFYGTIGLDRFGSFISNTNAGNILLSYYTNINGYERQFYVKADSGGNINSLDFGVSEINLVSDQIHLTNKIYKDKILTTWTDTRNGFNDDDIYLNIRSYRNPDSTVSIKNISNQVPSGIKLYQNYPNPFNSETIIKFDLNKTSNIKLRIFDVLGKEIKSEVKNNLQPGSYAATIDFINLPTGIYIYQLFANGEVITQKKLIFLK